MSKIQMKRDNHYSAGSTSGMSLIEVVGTLAAVSFLLAIGAKTTFESIDNAKERAEADSLESIAYEFREYVRDTRHIPGVDGWVDAVSVGLAMSPHQTGVNAVGNGREMLVDPDFWSAGENTLPYIQGVSGRSEPVNPRLIFISSVGADLPEGELVFQDLWDADISGEAPEASPWDSWDGSWDDINIERVNLSTLFHHVVINNPEGDSDAGYRIDGVGNEEGTPMAVLDGVTSAFYLDGSAIELAIDGAPIVKDIVRSDRAYYYNGFEWGLDLGGETVLEPDSFSDLLCAQFRDWVDLYEISGDSIWVDMRQDRFDVLREFVDCPELLEMRVVTAQEDGVVYSGIYSVLGLPVNIGGINLYHLISGHNHLATETIVGTYDSLSQIAQIYDIESNVVGIEAGGLYSGVSLSSVVGLSSSGLDFSVDENELIGTIEYYVDIDPEDGVLDDEGSFYFFNYGPGVDYNNVTLVDGPTGARYQMTLRGNNFHNVSEAPPGLANILGLSVRVEFDAPPNIL